MVPSVDTTPGRSVEGPCAELEAYLEGISGDLASPGMLEDVDPTAYDVAVVPGGHGPTQDLPVDPDIGRIVAAALDADKTAASLYHGPAAFLAAATPTAGCSPVAN